jgi:hypothetical protein
MEAIDDMVWVPAFDAVSCGGRESQLGFITGDVDDGMLYKLDKERMGVEDLGDDPESVDADTGWQDLTPPLFSPTDRAGTELQLSNSSEFVTPQQLQQSAPRGERNLPHLQRTECYDSDMQSVLSPELLSPNSLGYSFDRGRNGHLPRLDMLNGDVSLQAPSDSLAQGTAYGFADPLAGIYREVCPPFDASGPTQASSYDNHNNKNSKTFRTIAPRSEKEISPSAATVPSPPHLTPSPPPAEAPPVCRACMWGKHESHICGKGRGLSVAGVKRPLPAQHASEVKQEDAPTPKKPAHVSSKPKKDDPDWVAPGRSAGSHSRYSASSAGARAERLQAIKQGLESGTVKIKIKEPKPVNKCTYEYCPNPYHTSGGWKWVTAETKAGGRDWRPYIGRLFCNACFTQVVYMLLRERATRVCMCACCVFAHESLQSRSAKALSFFFASVGVCALLVRMPMFCEFHVMIIFLKGVFPSTLVCSCVCAIVLLFPRRISLAPPRIPWVYNTFIYMYTRFESLLSDLGCA